MSLLARAILSTALAIGVAASGYLTSVAPEPPTDVLGPEPVTVVIDAKHSRFEPDYIPVTQGTEVRFVLVNYDPIIHELIIGPQHVHDRHADGTEPWHPPVPGEVSVGPLDRGLTTYRFDEPGTVTFACHLPGHYDYGMHGEIEVFAAL